MEQDDQPQKLNRKYIIMMPFFLIGAIGSCLYLQQRDASCVSYYDKTGAHTLWKEC